MCTSIISNRNKTIVGWNLDILDMEYRVTESDEGVYIEINDPEEGWLPLFGANSRGDFVGMPTCWPHDERSNPLGSSTDSSTGIRADAPAGSEENVIMLDIDLLTRRRTMEQVRTIAENGDVCSVPGVTFMSSLSDKEGNVLHIVPGQGYRYYEKPKYKVLTNFSPFKIDSEKHPWMGWDRYHTAEEILANSDDDFDVDDCFDILCKVSQEVCPTVVSMVFDVTEMTVYWCENRRFDQIHQHRFAGNI